MKKYIDTGKKDTRSGFGAGLLLAGRENPKVLALTADLKPSVKMVDFEKEFPDRFIECGIAEANMVGVASGLAIAGFVPFAASFAEFITGRVYDQVRQAVAYGNTNVKLAASHAGVTLGEDGATHQTMEDVALMRALPGMTVLVPCDYNQTLQATLAAARFEGPVYLRFGRPSVPNFTNPDEPFEIGKVYNMNPGKDITIAAMGLLVWEALQAAEMLEKEGISAEVLNVSTVKPLDCKAIIDSLAKTGCAVVAEEHGMAGGLGELLSGVAAAHKPVPFEFVNGGDRFGESGTPAELIEEFGLNAANIVAAAKKAIARK